MPEPTAEAWAQIRHDYENTDRPLAYICAEHDVSIPTVRYRMKCWGWTRRKPLIPRVGPAAALPLPACGERSGTGAERRWPGEEEPPHTEFVDSPPHPTSALRADVDLSPHSSPDGERSLAYAGRGTEEEPASIVPRLQSAVARVLPAIEATIARLASGSHHPRDMEQAGRTLSSLTRTLRELNGLLAEQHLQPGRCQHCDDMPEDIDEFRHALARRIHAFVESRTNPNGAVPGSALSLPQK